MDENYVMSSNKRSYLNSTKILCTKRLEELTDEEIFSLLDRLGWPEVPSKRFVCPKISQRLSLWLLNKLFFQLKRRITQQENVCLDSNRGKSKTSEYTSCNIGHPNSFRAGELHLVAYLISHMQKLDALSAYASVLSKLIFLDFKNLYNHERNSFGDVSLVQLLNYDQTKIKDALDSYASHIESVQTLASCLTPSVETSNGRQSYSKKKKLTLSFKTNDIIEMVLSDLELFKLWNNVYMEFTCASDDTLFQSVLSILYNILKHFTIIINVLLELLEGNTNIKSSYEHILDLLMEPLFKFRSRIDDMEMHTKMIYNDSQYLYDLNHVICDVAYSLFKVVSFPIEKKFIFGCCDFVSSEIFETSINVPYTTLTQVSGSSVPYSHRFMIKMITLLRLALEDEEQILTVRGVCIMLPDIVEKLLISTKSYIESMNSMRDVLYYNVSYFGILTPLVMNLSNKLFELPSNKSTLSISLLESILSFISTIFVANNFNIFVYNGDRSNLISEVVEQSIHFIFFCLEKGYDLHFINEAMFDRPYDVRRYLFEISNFGNDSCFMKFSHLLWTSLDILVSLKLEYADKNINELLKLIKRDYEAYYTHDMDNKTMGYFLSTKYLCDYNEDTIPSETFVKNLITAYSISNDFVSLIEHAYKFAQINSQGKLFFKHPKALEAFRMSSIISSQYQIPLVLNKFVSIVSDGKSFRFVSTILAGYLSGLEFDKTIIGRSTKEIHDLFKIISFSYDCMGLSLVLQFTTTTRKLISCININELPAVLYEILEHAYEYVVTFSEKKGCDVMTWLGIFWVSYHLLMVVNDTGCDKYIVWNKKLYKIIKNALKSITKSNEDVNLVKKAVLSIFPNLSACSGMPHLKSRVKNLIDFRLEAFDQKFSIQMAEMVPYLVNCNYSVCKIVFKKILSVIACEDTDVESKTILLSAGKLLIDKLIPTYGEVLFYKFAELCLVFSSSCKNTYSYTLIDDVLKIMLSVLEYEEDMENYVCFYHLTCDYLKVISGSTNLPDKKYKRPRLNIFVVLSEMKSLVNKICLREDSKHEGILKSIAMFHFKVIRKIGDSIYMNLFNTKYSTKDVYRNVDNDIENLVLKALGMENSKDLLKIYLAGYSDDTNLNNLIIVEKITEAINNKHTHIHLLETTDEQYQVIVRNTIDYLSHSSCLGMEKSGFIYLSAMIGYLESYSHHVRNHMEYLDNIHNISRNLIKNKCYGKIIEPLLLILYIILSNNMDLITSNFTKIYEIILNLISAKHESFHHLYVGMFKKSTDEDLHTLKILKVLFNDSSDTNLYCKAISCTWSSYLSAKTENDLRKRMGSFELLLLLVSDDFFKMLNDWDSESLDSTLKSINMVITTHLTDLCFITLTDYMDKSLLEFVVVNLQMNNSLSLRLYSETKKYVGEKAKKSLHTNVSDHLFTTSEIAVKILSKWFVFIVIISHSSVTALIIPSYLSLLQP
ncbi:hypothetical protein BEWA_011560 [Theileria equi strain WA]|uniref:Uncharacterized protein n=1 Tax=Theileria equi strain WA TaxID=1537102 RepID=L0B2M3_THEEQ|nr:hypothetical protein BEWA_011560 [Theileria equi strain WA]AFZ81738.1 hypothetical protein BEWA_011560 [Theileria equi strain WA]|eukprot:XP_004831404.1 hypothetical protein BEWA_011560 [Theileria equi strain WA]